MVDDASRGRHRGLGRLDQGDARLRVVRHATRQGVSAARNTGVRAAARYLGRVPRRRRRVGAGQAASSAVGRRGCRTRLGATGRSARRRGLRLLGGGPPLPPDEVLALLPSQNTLPAGGSNVVVRPTCWPRSAASTPRCSAPRTGTCGSGWRAPDHRPGYAVRSSATGTIAGNARTDPAPMVTEPRLLARRYGIASRLGRHAAARGVGLPAGRPAGCGGGYYLRAVAHGDLRSLGRASGRAGAPRGRHAARSTDCSAGRPRRVPGRPRPSRWLAPLRDRYGVAGRSPALRARVRRAWPVDVVALHPLGADVRAVDCGDDLRTEVVVGPPLLVVQRLDQHDQVEVLRLDAVDQPLDARRIVPPDPQQHEGVEDHGVLAQ